MYLSYVWWSLETGVEMFDSYKMHIYITCAVFYATTLNFCAKLQSCAYTIT